MSLIWEFQVDGVFHEAEWTDGSMRCTISTVQPIVDRLIAEGYKLPCGSAVIMVEPSLDNEAGAYAVISEAVFLVADFQTILNPQSDVTVGDDLIFPDANDIEKASFGGDRSAAGAYAASIRWGQRSEDFDPYSVPKRLEADLEPILQAMYPQGHETFTEDEEEAIQRYQYSHVNRPLREGRFDEQLQKDVESLDSAFEKAVPLTHDIIVTRGIPFGYRRGGIHEEQRQRDAFFKGLKEGQAWSDTAYSSTTYEDDNFWASSGNQLEIVIPKGTKVLPFRQMHFFSQPDTSRSRQEKEILLPRNSKFKVLATRDVVQSSGKTTRVLTVVLDNPNGVQKAKQSFGGDRSAAARYAAQVRWGTKAPEFDPLSVKEVTTHEMEQYLDGLYPFPDDEDYPFTSSHEAAIKEYTDEGWAINGALRGQAQEGVVIRPYSTVGKMDSAFEAAEPLTKAIVLHRGLDLKSFTDDGKATISFFDGMKVGQSFSDPAFGSTSASGKIGDEFGARSRIRMKIVVPEGAKVLPINTMIGTKHAYAGEKEVLLPRNTRMRLVKRTYGEWENIAGEGLTLTFVVEPTGGVQKARERRFGSRSEAAQYAAQVRWGNRGQEETPAFDPSTVPLRSRDEANQILDAMYPDGSDGVLSQHQRDAVAAYQMRGKVINAELRDGNDRTAAAVGVDRAFEAAVPLNTDLIVHRGLDFGRNKEGEKAVRFFSLLKVGESFSDEGFTSTSTSVELSRQWGGITGIRFEIAVKKGTRVLPMNPILGKRSMHKTEHEVLLPRRPKFKVWAITDEPNQFGGGQRPNYTKVIKVVME